MKKLFLLFSAIFFLAFSQVHAEETVCTMEYNPVCGTVVDGSGTTQKTFGNACMAGANNATDIVAGACETPVIGGETDEHGCLAGAGYSWDETLVTCVRVWEPEYLVSWAHVLGLTWYLVPDTFGFDRDISREEAAAMLARFVAPIRGEAPACPFTYKDAVDIDASLLPSVNRACGYGIMTGLDGYFSPHRSLSEAEVLALIIRTIDGEKQDENVTPWYKNYLTRASLLGMISMVDEDTMNTPITRGDFIQWLNTASRSMETSIPPAFSFDTALLGVWQLLSVDGTAITKILSGSTSPILLTVTTGSLSTQICNSTAGAFTTSSGVISAPVLFSTLMACLNDRGTIEQEFSPDGASYTVRDVRDVDGTGSELVTLFTMTTASGHVFIYKKLPEETTDDLTGTWKFLRYASDDMSVNSGNYPDLDMTFADDHVSATFCNGLSGLYSVSDETFTDTTLVSTKMMCGDVTLMKMESDFDLDGATFVIQEADNMSILTIETESGVVYTYSK